MCEWIYIIDLTGQDRFIKKGDWPSDSTGAPAGISEGVDANQVL